MTAVDRHLLAMLAITGSSVDVLGALYLAYDLLGGKHGPLRIMTRGVTYGVLFGAGFAVAMGPVFGIAGGLTHGLTLAWEFGRASRGDFNQALWRDVTASAIRALGFAVGTGWLFGPAFGLTFGLLSLLGQVIAYRFGMRPTLDYHPDRRVRITSRQLVGVMNRTFGYGAASYLSSTVSHQYTAGSGFAIQAGLAIGLITAVSIFCAPLVEWAADQVPERTMGVFGIVLIAFGFVLQSVQYWAVVLDWNVR